MKDNFLAILSRKNRLHIFFYRCVVAVIRHGDRTPKQKMKMEVKHPKFFEVFQKYDGKRDKAGHVKLKKPQQLQEILGTLSIFFPVVYFNILTFYSDIARELLDIISKGTVESEMIEERKAKLTQIKNVLEMYVIYQFYQFSLL